MKSFTDIEQSKKLAEILPIESADMFYRDSNSDDVKLMWEHVTPKVTTPCWSLAALLDIFPCSKESPIVNLTRGGWIPTTSNFTRLWFATWEDENKSIFYSCNGISPVDAVVRLILKLHKQELL